MRPVDVAIIGAGPTGLFAAYYAGFRGLSTAIIDALLVPGGLGSFTARPLPAAAQFGGAGLVYFVPHLEDLAGHHLVIVGGGDSAFDWAYSLHPIAASVTLVHRRDKFRAHAGTVAKVQ